MTVPRPHTGMSSSISAASAASRENARQTNGRFGEQTHADPGQIALAGPADPTRDGPIRDMLGPGDQMVVPESEHGDASAGDVTVGVSPYGTPYVEGGPVVGVWQAFPTDVSHSDYQERWPTLAALRAAEAYGARPEDTGDVGEPRLVFHANLDDEATTSEAVPSLGSVGGFAQLRADLWDVDEDGSIRFARNLAETLPEGDLPDLVADPRVVDALGEGPELSENQRYMLNVLLDPRNDPAQSGRDLDETLEGYQYWNGDASDWSSLASVLDEHARRRGTPGGLSFNNEYGDDADHVGYSVGVYHAGLGSTISTFSSGDPLQAGGDGPSDSGLRDAVGTAEAFDGEWRILRARMDRTFPTWRDTAHR